MLKSEIIDRVSELVQDSSGGMRALISGWINIVLDDIASRGHLRSLEREETTPIITGERDYELPAQTDHVFKVFVPAWGIAGILKKIDHDEFIEKLMCDGANAQGQPRYYNLFGNRTIRLHPPAAAEFATGDNNIDYSLHLMKYKDIAHLADDEEITEIKIKHIPVIIAGAYHFGARFDALGDVADARATYERGVNRIIGDQDADLERAKQVRYRDLG